MVRRSGYVRIDINEFIGEIEDDVLLEEVALRKLAITGGAAYDDDLVKEAHHELLVGRVAEALAILDRLLNPKWKSQKNCLSDYVKATGKML